MKSFQDFYWIQSWTLHTAKSRVKFDAFSQNIKTVSTGGIEEKPASPVYFLSAYPVPFLASSSPDQEIKDARSSTEKGRWKGPKSRLKQVNPGET